MVGGRVQLAPLPVGGVVAHCGSRRLNCFGQRFEKVARCVVHPVDVLEDQQGRRRQDDPEEVADGFFELLTTEVVVERLRLGRFRHFEIERHGERPDTQRADKAGRKYRM